VKRHRFLFLVCALLGSAGCPTRDKYDPLPSVRITTPIGDTYTNGRVDITASVDPDLDLPVVLRRDGTVTLATLTSWPYAFEWDTTSVAEGPHTVVAEVALSSGTVTSAAVTIVVDRTGPTITLTPAPGATDVALRAPIQAAFSEPIVLPQPIGSAFTVSAGATQFPVAVTLDAGDRTATIRIADPSSAPLDATYSATVSDGITDRAGNPLIAPSGSWTWRVPQWVKLPQIQNTTIAALAVSSDFHPVVAYATSGQLAVAFHDSNGWNQLSIPSTATSFRSIGIALDATDRPIVGWLSRNNLIGDEMRAASWNGAGWNVLPVIAGGKQVSARGMQLRIDGDGDPAVAWQDDRTGDCALAKFDGSSWQQAFPKLPIGGPSTFDLALGANGDPVVAWVDNGSAGHVAIGAGGAWTNTPDFAMTSEAALALDSRGNPLVVTGKSGTIIVQRLTGGSAWQPLQAASIPPQSTHLRIATGPDDSPVLAWFEAQTTSVGMARWTGQQWDTRQVFFAPPLVADESPQLAVDRNGTAWIGWRDSAGVFSLWMMNY